MAALPLYALEPVPLTVPPQAAPLQQQTTFLPPADFAPAWRPAFAGIDLANMEATVPPFAVYAARIDLSVSGIGFLVTPRNPEHPETAAQKVTAFLNQHKLQLAVNASLFSPVDDIEGSPRDIKGISMSRGDLYSKPAQEGGALIITRDNHVRIAEQPIKFQDAYNAVAGRHMLLRDGKNVAEKAFERNPRTACGLSKDERYLYFIVIDGRQIDHSIGATLEETAEWLHAFGAWQALNLDGGGSTALAIAGENGEPKLLNRPIHEGIPGNERLNGNNLGVFANPLPKP
jgi:hypothetical protein